MSLNSKSNSSRPRLPDSRSAADCEIDEALWAAYRRYDKSAVTKQLLRRYLTAGAAVASCSDPCGPYDAALRWNGHRPVATNLPLRAARKNEEDQNSHCRRRIRRAVRGKVFRQRPGLPGRCGSNADQSLPDICIPVTSLIRSDAFFIT
jgi:hypothetical protein